MTLKHGRFHPKMLQRLSYAAIAALANLPMFSAPASAQTVDHFEFSPVAPGTKSGSHPYAVFAGACQQIAVIARDSTGNTVTSYNGNAVITQWLINYQNGNLLEAAPGISQFSSIGTSNQLGLSSITVTMTNGVYTFGAGGDLSTQLCFYYATRDPQDFNQSPSNPQQNGDLILRATLPDGTKPGNGTSYLGWHNTAQKLLLTAPLQSYVPASQQGSTGAVSAQSIGEQFTLEVRMTDAYWNRIFDNKTGSSESDTVQFTASNAAGISISPFQGAMTEGFRNAFATVISSSICNSTISITASDVTDPGITSSVVSIYISTCAGGSDPPPPPPTQNPGYYQLTVPSVVTAGQSFNMSIVVNNVNISNVGGLQYSGRLIPLIATSNTTFSPASGTLGTPTFDFTIPQGIVQSSYPVTISQSYTTAQTIWIQLIAENPVDLSSSSAIGGPILVLPGTPSAITGSATPSTLGALGTSVISLGLVDAFNNGIAGAVLAVQQTAGTQGTLNGIDPGFTQLVLTDAAGKASLTFISGTASEDVNIRASAQAYPAITAKNIPIAVSLLGNATISAYPSPVTITQRPLTIEYKLAQASEVKLTITDLFGQEIWKASFSAGGAGGAAGHNRVSWDGKNGRGTTVAVGIYVVHMEANANGAKVVDTKYRFGVKK
ncbi:MAG: hypothetical protein HY551_05170 [Elusimicrobia bacterium]|nr:hypothetical protein [Elusimicrobiota bacterium]